MKLTRSPLYGFACCLATTLNWNNLGQNETAKAKPSFGKQALFA